MSTSSRQTKPIYTAGLDLGSAVTRCVIAKLDGSRLHFAGAGATLSGSGWNKSRVVDRPALSASALKAVQMAEAEAGIQLESVVVGCGGLTVRGANTRSRTETGRPREIEQRDVNRAFERAARVQLQDDRMILQLCPQEFALDDRPGFRDPRKMVASSLEVNAHLITISALEHNTIVDAVNHAHLTVDETVFEAVAACYAAVLPEERRDGLALIDIGSQSTQMVVYYGDATQLASTIPVAGDHFTRDVAHYLRVGYDDAQQVKEQYGCALSGTAAENSYISLPTQSGRESRDASRAIVNEILEARAEELFTLAQQELAKVGMDHALASGMVLSGGGAMLQGMCDVAERILNCPARLGLPTGLMDFPEDLDTPDWTVAAGLAMYSARLHSLVDLERQSIGLLGRILR
jgi:cell division protein FtsA